MIKIYRVFLNFSRKPPPNTLKNRGLEQTSANSNEMSNGLRLIAQFADLTVGNFSKCDDNLTVV